MKQTYLFGFPTFIFISVLSAQPVDYTLTTLSETYSDLTEATSLNNGEIWDEPEYIVPIPFPFELNGNEIEALEFIGSGAFLYSPTSDPDIETHLFAFETDLIDRGSNGLVSLSPLSYKVDGSPGSQILKVEFNNAGSYYEMAENGTLDMFINFQFWIYETSNRIEFRFGPSSIPDPDLFYDFESGAYIGLWDYNVADDIPINPQFLIGGADNPVLSSNVTSITGTPSNGTVYRLSVELPIDLEVTGEDATSICNPNGSATANVTGGLEPYTYSWSNGEDTQTIADLDEGTYSVTVTDANLTTATGSIFISNVDPIEVNASSTDETSVNANDGTATAAPSGGLAPYEYEWSNGETEFMITGLAPGVYTVTVTDSEGCTAAESVTVNAFGCGDLEIIFQPIEITCFGACDGEIEIVDIVQGTPPFTYLWSNGSTNSSIENLCAGDYSVTVTDSDGCNASASFLITEPSELLVNAGATNESIPGASDGTAWAAPTGGTTPYNYLWSNGSVDSLITGLPTGSYTVTVTDANECSSTQTVVVDVFNCFFIDVVVLNNACDGDCLASITPILFNVVEPITFLWSNGSTEGYIDSLCPGTYSVTLTDAVGCTLTGSFTVTDPPQLFANAASTDETSPGASDGTAWATPSGGSPPYSYAWNIGSTDSLIVDLEPGIYTVTVTDDHGCVATQSVTVNQFPCQGFIEFGGANVSCYGLCDGSADVNVVGGVGPISYVWNTGDTTNVISNLCPDTYIVTVTDLGQNCEAIFEFIISQPDSLIITIDEVVHLTDSTNTSISISVTGGTEPYLYAWTGSNGTMEVTEDISDIAPGFYSIEVSDASGCITVIDSIEVKDETVGISTIYNLDVHVYPNPAKEQVFIEVGDVNNYQLQLFNSDGRMVESWNDVKTINVSEFVPGVYLLKCTSGERLFVHRIMIVR